MIVGLLVGAGTPVHAGRRLAWLGTATRAAPPALMQRQALAQYR